MSDINTQSPTTTDEQLWAAQAEVRRLKKIEDALENLLIAIYIGRDIDGAAAIARESING
jgi:hypothetical protein